MGIRHNSIYTPQEVVYGFAIVPAPQQQAFIGVSVMEKD